MGKTIIWTHQADAELNKAFLDLLVQFTSLETTTRIISEIYKSTSILATNPEIYKLDALKKKNGYMKSISFAYPIWLMRMLFTFSVYVQQEKNLWNIKKPRAKIYTAGPVFSPSA